MERVREVGLGVCVCVYRRDMKDGEDRDEDSEMQPHTHTVTLPCLGLSYPSFFLFLVFLLFYSFTILRERCRSRAIIFFTLTSGNIYHNVT